MGIWNKNFRAKGYEKCVVCRATTDVPTDMPVSERKWYVPGAGQLCKKCCMELYGTDDLRSFGMSENGCYQKMR